MRELLDGICLRLRQTLDAGSFKVWIEPLSAVYEAGSLTLYTPYAYAAVFIQKRLLSSIRSIASEVAGMPVVVTLCAAPAAAGAVPLVPRELASGAGGQGEATVPSLSLPASSPASPGLSPCAPAQAAVAYSGMRQPYLPLLGCGGRRTPAWRYSFDSFVVGPSNELAVAAARSICRDGDHTDVLFLSSGAGLGKTHLVQAMGRNLYEDHARSPLKIECLTAEEFVSRLYAAIKMKETSQFKSRYRDIDVLLMEDVHFLQGKEVMQEELLATIKALQERGGKVVFSSSFIPRDLRQMGSALLSRLNSGLTVEISRPDLDTRKRIVREKAKCRQVVLPEEVTEILAEHITDDVRQIEGCLHTLILKARALNHSGIDARLAWEVLGQYRKSGAGLDLERIIDLVCRGFGVSLDQLCAKSRKHEFVTARNAIFYLARKHTHLSLQEIGRQFHRTHSSVIKGITTVEREISLETALGRQMADALTLVERNGGIAPHA